MQDNGGDDISGNLIDIWGVEPWGVFAPAQGLVLA